MAEWPYSTAQWQRLRKVKLSASPLCEDCRPIGRMVQASHVDHVHAISDGGPPFPGLDGLRALCLSCHSAKTARGPEAGAIRSDKPRRGCDANGNPLDRGHPWADKSLRAGPVGATGDHKIELVSKGNRNGR